MQQGTHLFPSLARAARNRNLDPSCKDEAAHQRERSGGHIVQHDSGSLRQLFEPADGPGLPDVEETEEEERQCCVGPFRRTQDEGEELAGYFVDDDEAWVFAGGLAGRDGGGGDANERDEDRCEGGGDREGRVGPARTATVLCEGLEEAVVEIAEQEAG